ncbi:MAG: nicotinate (nicotinamide) nucleotide adenylyltransferase [Treponema sp.]|nr:nicotinate (nicotinamide) nucleotide adenylyltransferase [Treponema sp.]
MKIAVLGGSFNPIHIGHLILADEICTVLGYDKVLFVPTYRPPHKQMFVACSEADRLEMVRLACEDDDRFEVEPCEMERGGVSYTYDTVLALEQKYQGQLDAKIGLVFGQDLAGEFCKWNHYEELLQKTSVIVAFRPEVVPVKTNGEVSCGNSAVNGYTGESINDEQLLSLPYPCTVVHNVRIPVSSTDIRNRIAAGKSWRYLVPQKVCEYIISNKIYGCGKITDNS